MAVDRTRPGLAAYSVAKMAAVGLMFVAAAEGEPRGILANAVAPAAATRVFTRPTQPGELEPEQVVPGVVFLASEECRVNGKVLEAGGGEFDVARWVSGEDVALFSPEELAERWSELEGVVRA
jgi:NAD(P)-dependent dehydrogenase (short-subunit alcohol dehydrogenase family)